CARRAAAPVARWQALLGAPKRVRSLAVLAGRAAPHRLDVGELFDSILRQLPAVARPLHAAEGQPRVGCDHAVDEDEPRLDTLRELLGSLDVTRPDVGAEPEVRIVGDPKGVLGVLDPDHSRNRPERLLVVRGHARPHVRQDGGLEVVAVAAYPLAARQRARPEAHRSVALSLDLTH